jgi:hypothetical protein
MRFKYVSLYCDMTAEKTGIVGPEETAVAR